MKKLMFTMSVAMLLVVGANAALINGDFELGDNANGATNWTDFEAAANDVYYVPGGDTSRYPDPWSRSMTLKGYSGATGSQQILDAVQDSYTFSFDAGFRNDGVAGSADLVVSIWDTVAGAALASETITVSASGTVAQSDPTWGNWNNYTVTLDVDTTGVSEVALRFANSSGGTWQSSAMVDNVVPEPATLALLGLGAIVTRRRRK